jgi:hypothetical protein
VQSTVAALVVPASAAAFDPVVEALNFNTGNERQTIYDTPQYTALLARVSLANEKGALTAQAADPEREFQTDLCARRERLRRRRPPVRLGAEGLRRGRAGAVHGEQCRLRVDERGVKSFPPARR